MSDPAARCLTAIALVGGWNEEKAGDIACLEAVTAKKYEELERELLHVARLDDPPVLKIGAVWKAKAPLELLYLFAPEFTRDELSRFFATAQAVLAKPDPALELKPDQRWMASIYGKVREESGIVINSITDSLAKLSVYSENNSDERIGCGVHALVKSLLDDADDDRWLSVSRFLRELAEASPDIFLRAVENSLHRADAPIRRLFAEGNGDALFGRMWHTNLLWALETLAWSTKYLGRAADVLAQLTSAPLPQNIGNRPVNSLVSLFRPWWPQTTATPEQRLAVLDRLIQQQNDVAWDLLLALIPRHPGFASANAKPHWRDDDAGASGPNEQEGFGQYMSAIGARVIGQAHGNPARIAKLIEALDSFGGEYREQIVQMVIASGPLSDEDREVVRSALRKYLSWHYSFSRGTQEGRATADRLRPQFDLLAPTDLVLRHAWIFKNGWVEMPDGRDEDYKKADELRENLRAQGLRQIFDKHGWDGVDRLVQQSGAPGLVGWQIARGDFDEAEVVAWSLRRLKSIGAAFHDSALSGLLHAQEVDHRLALLAHAVVGLDIGGIAAMVSAAPCDRATWTFLQQQPQEAQSIYWRNVQPGTFVKEGDDLGYLVDRLLEAGRPRTAFQAINIEFKKADPERVMKVLEQISVGTEPEAALPDGWHIGEAIKAIDESGIASRRQLALLEFRYSQALQHAEHSTKNLYAEMLDDPSLFVECICLVYLPLNKSNAKGLEANESSQAAATIGWNILHHGRGVPGQQPNGTVDQSKFDLWITKVRQLALEQDRRDVADISIGEWLSSCPADADGTWPCQPVRNLLEQQDTERIRNGFHTGVMNNRGVHSRAMGAGGDQERDLATRYRAFATPLEASYPETAAVLEAIAQDYDGQGRWHDLDSALWKEGAR